MASDVKFEKWFTKGFELYKGSAILLIVTTLLAGLIGNLTVGILAGPMLAGLLMITLRLHDRAEPVPQIGDLFKGFEHFANAFLLTLAGAAVIFAVWIAVMVVSLVVGWIPLLGGLAVLALYFLVMALMCVLGLVLWFSLCLMVDQGMDLKTSIATAVEKVKGDIWNFAGFAIVASLAASAGVLLCGVGVFITLPFYACAITVAYRDLWKGDKGDAEEGSTNETVVSPSRPPETETETGEADAAEPEAEPGPQEDEGGEKPPTG